MNVLISTRRIQKENVLLKVRCYLWLLKLGLFLTWSKGGVWRQCSWPLMIYGCTTTTTTNTTEQLWWFSRLFSSSNRNSGKSLVSSSLRKDWRGWSTKRCSTTPNPTSSTWKKRERTISSSQIQCASLYLMCLWFLWLFSSSIEYFTAYFDFRLVLCLDLIRFGG